MTDRPPQEKTPPTAPLDPPFEDALRAAAAVDTPPDDLYQRIVARLERNHQLEALIAEKPKRPQWHVLTTLGFSISAAAAIGFFYWRSGAPTVEPERLGTTAERSESKTTPTASNTPAPSLPRKPAPQDPCLKGLRAVGDSPVIDDFEDGDDLALAREQRTGFWRWNRDIDKPGTAPALLPTDRPFATKNNQFAIHVKGATLRDWGASVEMTFDSSCYDASAYSGISFSARGPGRIYVSPREVDVIPPEFGGTCEKDCYNGHVKKIDLGKNFQTYEVRWAEVAQRGYSRPTINPKRLHDIAFLIHAEDTPYDIWLDDVKFLRN
jgi:hypothetical protein